MATSCIPNANSPAFHRCVASDSFDSFSRNNLAFQALGVNYDTSCSSRHLSRERHPILLDVSCLTVQFEAESFFKFGAGVKNGGNGLYVLRRNWWKPETPQLGYSCQEKMHILQDYKLRVSTESPITHQRLSGANDLRIVSEELYGGDPESFAKADVGNMQDVTKYIGVQQVRGRFAVELQNDGLSHKLIFDCQKEAAKAYDKAAYKLSGSSAKLNFGLTKEEKREVEETEWEDLLLHMQSKGVKLRSPCRLGFPGVFYKEEEQLWQVMIKKEKKEVYVGLFSTITEARKAYDLAIYKLHGKDALLSQPLSSSERKELIDIDWDSLTAKLGLKIRPKRVRRDSGCIGVHIRPAGTWHASVSHGGDCFYLGTFDSKAAAAKAYDLFAYKLLGDKAKVNEELLPEEKEFLLTISVPNLRKHLASDAVIAPKILHLGARGVRLVQGKWEVCVESSRKDRIYTCSASSEQKALKVHDLLVHKLYNGVRRTYAELTTMEKQAVESTDWNSLASKFDVHQMRSYEVPGVGYSQVYLDQVETTTDRGVNRLISGLWQSYVRNGGAYLPIGTFNSAETAARVSDKCEFKLLRKDAILNFPLSEGQKLEVASLDWATLISNLREEQKSSPVLELEKTLSILSVELQRKRKWVLVLCNEQLLLQQIARRAPKVGRQLVVSNPSLASHFSEYNRRADGSPMLVEEVMEGCNTPLLWWCACGNIFLKSPMALFKRNRVFCKMAGCTVSPPTARKVATEEP